MDLNSTLPLLLGTAWLLPLASFALILLFGPRMGKAGRGAGFVATAAIVTAFVLSAAALTIWLSSHPIENSEHASAAHDSAEHGAKAVENHATENGVKEGGEAAVETAHPAGIRRLVRVGRVRLPAGNDRLLY